ncbi:hypothetical protein LPJ81_000187 [Coemansia sp. IMI 209127]|nr:hypothetical protein LPJ81_000187 [Coemansia sp. IMI 209127]
MAETSSVALLATQIARATATTASDEETSSMPEINIDVSYLFDWGNAPGTGPYFSANNIDAATQITTAALMGGACLFVFSMLRMRWPELYSHRLRLRYMRPSNIPRTLFGWVYPIVTMSDRHVLETIGLDAVLFFRAYRMFIYMFLSLAVFGMAILYPVNFFWSKEYQGSSESHTVFDSPLSYVKELSGRYSVAHVFLAYVFAFVLFFYIDRFALHAITMRWHYLLLTRRSGNSRTLMMTRLPPELRTPRKLSRFVQGMGVGTVESVHIPPADGALDRALAARGAALQGLETAYTAYLGNPCRARTYDPLVLKRVVLAEGADARDIERRLLYRWARQHKGASKPVDRPRTWVRRTDDALLAEFGAASHAWLPRIVWPFVHVDAIDYWRHQLTGADRRLRATRDAFVQAPAGSVAFVTMRRPVDAYIISQLNVHARPGACRIQMAPEARAIAWANVARPHARKLARVVVGVVMTVALLLLWCVPVILISTLISLRFLVTRIPGLVDVVKDNKFVRSLLSYTLPSLILTIFMTILPRLLWSFVLVGGDRSFAEADKDMLIRHLYFLVIYIVVIFGMSGSVWSSVYDLFTDFGGFWDQLVTVLPQMASWYCVYVMLYGAGYQVMKLLHLKSVCRFLFIQARARTPRDYMRAISPVFIDWGTFQPYTVLFFFIGILYSHLQPLLLPMTVLYFLVGLLVMKYMCVYAWYFRHQSAGAIWPILVRRMVVCVLLYQAMTTAVFASNSNHWFVAPMLVLMLFTWYYFWVRCKYLRRLSDAVPLQLLREAERRRASVLEAELVAAQLKHRQQQQGDPAVAWDLQAEECIIPKSTTADSPATTAAMPGHRGIRRLLERAASRVLDIMVGDPAAPLWEHIDDYAFPERVDRAINPAGRTHADPHMSKTQPGSLVDILRSIVYGIPRALRAVASEFFLGFDVPRAYLDTSVAEYPRVRNTEDAFKSGRSLRRRDRQREEAQGSVAKASDSEASDYEVEEAAAGRGDGEALLLRTRLQKMASGDYSTDDEAKALPNNNASVADFCLAPEQTAATRGDHLLETSAIVPPAMPPLPGQEVPLHRATTFVSLYDSRTGKPTAMQYQAQSTELPHGTHMNRKKTDFSQANSSRVAGVLDSTRFSYLHPGMYGDLPSLWLPVASLKSRRNKKKYESKQEKTHGGGRIQKFRDAVDAVEDAIGDNFIGPQNMARLQEKRRELRSHALRRMSTGVSGRLQVAASRSGASSAVEEQPSVSEQQQQQSRLSFADTSEAPQMVIDSEDVVLLTPAELQSRADDLHVESQCRALGIDPAVVREWDPTGLHRCISTHDVQQQSDETDPAAAAAAAADLSLLRHSAKEEPTLGNTTSLDGVSSANDGTDTVPSLSDVESSASDNDSDAYDAYNDTQNAIGERPAASRHRRLPTLVSIISAPLQRRTTAQADPEVDRQVEEGHQRT